MTTGYLTDLPYDYDPRDLGAQCDRCSLKGAPVVPSRGLAAYSELCIIAEAPGIVEEALAEPLVGPSGQETDRALLAAGLRREDTFMSNVCLCRPQDTTMEGHLATVAARNKRSKKDGEDLILPAPVACYPRLMHELQGAKALLLMGAYARQIFYPKERGDSKLMASRGFPSWAEVKPASTPEEMELLKAGSSASAGITGKPTRCLATVHPAFALRMGRWIPVFRADVDKAVRASRNQLRWQDPEMNFFPTPEQLANFLVEIEASRQPIAYDTETRFGLDWSRPKALRLLGIGTAKRAMCVPFQSVQEVPEVDYTAAQLRRFGEILVNWFAQKGSVCAHNCLTKGANVLLTGGITAKLGDMVRTRHPGPVMSLNERTGVLEPKRVTGWVRLSSRPWAEWVRLRFIGGRSLQCTRDHKVLTSRGWVRAGALVVGDAVVTALREFTPGQTAVLYGTLMGDGRVHLNGRGARIPSLTLRHCAAQREYLLWKRDALGLAGKTRDHVDAAGYAGPQGAPMTSFVSLSDPRLLSPWVDVYDSADGQRRMSPAWLARLSPAAIAIWLADDGGLTNGDRSYVLRVCVSTFVSRGLDTLLSWLAQRGWPVRLFTRKDGHVYIVFSDGVQHVRRVGPSEASDKFWSEVAPYFPGPMSYKVPKRYRHLAGTGWRDLLDQPGSPWAAPLCAVEPIVRKSTAKWRVPGATRFCLEVEDNHNFVADGCIVSNSKFDHLVCSHARDYLPGWRMGRRVFDTLLAHHDSYSELPHSLEFLSAQYTDAPAHKAVDHSAWSSDRVYHTYNMRDVAITAICAAALAQDKKLIEQKVVFEADHKLSAFCRGMEETGIWIDPRACVEQADALRVEMDEANRDVRKMLGDISLLDGGEKLKKELADGWEFNPGSPPQIGKLLYEMLDVVPLPASQGGLTDTGRPSVEKPVLFQLCDRGMPQVVEDLIQRIIDFREAQKLKSTYCDPMLPGSKRQTSGDIRISADGRLLVVWNPHVVVSGRLSASPNVMNFKESMRAILAAPPGHAFACCDKSQLEARVVAILAGEEKQIAAFLAGADIHKVNAVDLFGLSSVDDVTPELRQFTKTFVYAAQYLAGPKKIAQMLRVFRDKNGKRPYRTYTVAEAETCYNRLWESRATIKRWHEQNRALQQQVGFLAGAIHGRRRYFMDGATDDHLDEEKANFVVQCTAAEDVNDASFRLVKEFPWGFDGPHTGIVHQNHDSLIIDCREEHVIDVGKRMAQIMDSKLGIMPLPVELKVGKNYRDLKKVKIG
jgi:DNA polymerase I-like protein with 3'-5' exonuclease and polymerase domains/uracil-DNA glycosylase